MHINNALREELADEVVVTKFANTTKHGAIEGKTQAQMAELFEKTPQNITMHIGNAYREGELERESTCKEYLQVQ